MAFFSRPYISVTRELLTRLIRVEDDSVIWSFEHSLMNRYATHPIGFSNNNKIFYLGTKSPSGKWEAKKIIYTTTGYECLSGCIAASTGVALKSDNCTVPSVDLFNFNTGETVLQWSPLFTLLEDCDFRYAEMDEELAKIIRENGGIVDESF